VYLALVAAGMAGCGGNLGVAPDGGAGGSAGTNGRGGTTGAGGRSTAGSTGTAGSPYIADYTWGGVTVHVAPTSTGPSGLVLMVNDRRTPDQVTITSFPGATRWYPIDGAYASATFGCVSPAIIQVEINTCDYYASSTPPPGCLRVNFHSYGVGGDFVQANGAHCPINAGTATINVPPPDLAVSVDGGPPPDLAMGTFMLECADSGGTTLQLAAQFAIPVQSSFLLCANSD